MREINAIILDVNLKGGKDGGLPSTLKVLPLGEIKGRDGRYWNLPFEDAQRIVDKIEANGIDIVIDLNHGSYYGDARAAGWLKADTFVIKEDGIYADCEWTELGRAEINARHYRYLSPTILTERDRILELESVGLVNIPNLRELPALNKKSKNLEDDCMSERNHLESRVAELQENVLKLTQEKGDLERELNAVKTERDEALRKLADAEAKIADFERRELEMNVNSMLEKALEEGRIAPSQRDTLKAMGMRDMNALKEFIEKSPPRFDALKTNYGAEGSGKRSPNTIGLTTEFDSLKAQGVQVDDARLEIHKNALRLAAQMQIPYTQAVAIVSREV